MKIVLAGGGTAGHVEPALAIARAWQQRYPQSEILFLGTKSGLENHLVPAGGFQISYIEKVVVPRKISRSLFALLKTFICAFRQARVALKGSDLLIGFGGYVSAPAYLAARSLKIPFVVHEANAKPGIANRLGAVFTDFLAVAQPIERGKLSKALTTGLPLRGDIAKAVQESALDWRKARNSAKRALGFDPGAPVVVAFFGSQGSVALNKVITAALDVFSSAGIQVLHSLGKANKLPEAAIGYKPVSYISDMATTYLAADLIIARSGAVTCSEVNALGRYALFIPLPIGNGEQKVNARAIIEQSRGELVEQSEFNAAWISNNIDRLLQNSDVAPIAGNQSDLSASEKIVALMEEALAKGAK